MECRHLLPSVLRLNSFGSRCAWRDCTSEDCTLRRLPAILTILVKLIYTILAKWHTDWWCCVLRNGGSILCEEILLVALSLEVGHEGHVYDTFETFLLGRLLFNTSANAHTTHRHTDTQTHANEQQVNEVLKQRATKPRIGLRRRGRRPVVPASRRASTTTKRK